ncbi:MAG: hypothetical protein EAZ92_00780 [Candidatus Kapaibacterium sp.]|nr:MAG: hypothetical protein EAZ92_00780 [Candidatus Kapabacteria bacterium]
MKTKHFSSTLMCLALAVVTLFVSNEAVFGQTKIYTIDKYGNDLALLKEYPSAKEAMMDLPQNKPEVILVDIGLSGQLS